MITLARRAGVARATLYNYFPSAERVLEALVKTEVAEFLSDLGQRLETVPDPGERLNQAISALVGWAGAQAAGGAAPARRHPSARPPDVAAIHRPLAAIQDRIREIFTAARDAGALSPHTEPDLAAGFTVTLVLGIRWQLGGACSDGVSTALQGFLLAGLGAPRPDQLASPGPAPPMGGAQPGSGDTEPGQRHCAGRFIR